MDRIINLLRLALWRRSSNLSMMLWRPMPLLIAWPALCLFDEDMIDLFERLASGSANSQLSPNPGLKLYKRAHVLGTPEPDKYASDNAR